MPRCRDYHRLGFSLQLVTVRYLSMFLADPLDVPAELIEYLAERAWEIQRVYGLVPYADVESCRPGLSTRRG
ncbi:DUF4158 domain-containing protein [Nocardia sp. NPDC004711]